MSNKSYLDDDGLLYVWNKAKAKFAEKGDIPTGTVTSVTMNGTKHEPTSGDINLGTVITSHQDISGKADKTATVSTVAWDSTNSKITKTINGTTTDVVSATTLENAMNEASTSAKGLMSANDKTKLNGVASGAEVNQNAFSNVVYGSTTISADSKTDTLTFAAGNNVQISADATNDKLTISAIDTTYSVASSSANGLMSSTDKSKLDGFQNASNYALKTDITNVYKYKGSVATADLLPTTGLTGGDVYDIQAESTYGPAGQNVAWNSTSSTWDPLGGIFSITSITNAEIDTICV